MGLPSWNAASIVRFIRTNREAPLAILIGVTTSLVISAFIWTTELLGARLYTSSSPAWMRLVFPAAGALLSGLLLYRFFPDARGYSIIVPLRISNLLSFWVARRWIRTPIYEQLAAQDGVHLPKPADERAALELTVRDAMRPVSLLLDPDTEVGEAALYPGKHFLVGRNGILWGIVSAEDLFQAPGHIRLAELLPCPPDKVSSPPASLLPICIPISRSTTRCTASALRVLPSFLSPTV